MRKGGTLRQAQRSELEGWKVERLGDVCEIDKIPNRKKNLPYVGLEHIESNTGKFIGSTEPQSVKSMTFNFSDKHVLYGRLRPYLKKVLLPDFEGHCSSEIFPLKVSNQLNRRYLFHWLLSDETTEKINATSTGARMPRANMNYVLDFEIPIPPLPEQQQIVSVLDEAFASIAQAKSNAERNLVNARELFEAVSREIFEDGKNWDEKLLGDVCKVAGEITRDIDTSLPYIGADSIESNTGRLIQKKTVLEQGIRGPISSFSGKKLLYSKIRPYLNKLTISNFKGYCSSDMYPLEFDKSVLYEYAQHYLLSKKFLNSISGFYQRAAIPKINRNDLFSVSMPVPPLAEQRAIVERLEALSAETKRLEEIYQSKVEALDELKKSVLREAFEGRL